MARKCVMWRYRLALSSFEPKEGLKMAAVMQQILERSEISKLPKAVQNKLEKFFSDQQSEIDSLKSHHERFKVDSGKLFCKEHFSTAMNMLWNSEPAQQELLA